MRTPPLPLRQPRALLALLAPLLAGCVGSGDVMAPAGTAGAAARASVAARVQLLAADGASLRLTPAYLRQDASRVPLAPVTATLGSAREEQVAVEIEFGACLADAQRAGFNGGPAATDECVLFLAFALVVDGAVVDSQTVGPVVLRPGARVTPAALVLQEAAALELSLADGTPLPAGGVLTFPVGDRRALLARMVDGAGRRRPAPALSWTVSPAGIATVTGAATATITGTAPGAGTVGVSGGGVEAAYPIRVVRVPAALRVEATPGSTGRLVISSAPAGIACTLADGVPTGTCERTFPGDTTVLLTVTPEGLTEFTGYAGDCAGTATCVLPMTAPRAVRVGSIARFPLVVSGAGTGSGLVVSTPDGIRCLITDGVAASTGCMAAVRIDTDVELAFQPLGDALLTGWSGDCTGANRCAFRMTGARAVTATLSPRRALQVGGGGSGSGTITSAPAGISCTITDGAPSATGCRAEFPQGSVVTLTATPVAGSDFAGWQGACSGTGGCSVTLATDQGVRAIFEARQTLTVAGSGTGSGTLTSSPAGISCTITDGVAATTGCSASFPRGASVTLAAAAASGSDFARWEGGCTGTEGCAVTLNTAARVTGVFEARQRLTVEGGGSGSGTITSAPAGISCTVTDGVASTSGCSALFPRGAAVSLTVTPAPDNNFTGWQGACSSLDPCELRLLAPASVTARFSRQRLLTVTASGGGNGLVVSFPSGIRCEVVNGVRSASGCSARFPEGTAVSLSVTADAATTFTGWSGACTGSGACQVSLAQDATVNAALTAWPRLTVTGAGNGRGTVVSSPSGISCSITGGVAAGGGCSTQFAPGTAVSLQVFAANQSTFTGWSGACTGTSSECAVVMTGNRTVTATLTEEEQPQTVRLSVRVAAGTFGSGTVTSSPQGINCIMGTGEQGGTCDVDLPSGTQVTLTATPGQSSFFAGWQGQGCGTSGPCSFRLTANATVFARFSQAGGIRLRESPPPAPPAPPPAPPRRAGG